MKSKEVGRFLAYLLRHHPEAGALSFDLDGFAPVGDLLHLIRLQIDPQFSALQLQALVAADNKGRFEFDPDGSGLRAVQGHSQGVYAPRLEACEPPALLYHGTPADPATLAAIRREGLRPMQRQHVHLSASREEALEVARRRARKGPPLILEVYCRQAIARKLCDFFRAPNGVWLAAPYVPTEILVWPVGSV